MVKMTNSPPSSAFVFRILSPSITPPNFCAPRLGRLSFVRAADKDIDIATPNFITSTSRGVVPHLSRDHVQKTSAIGWVHIPFESFLASSPPVPTLQPGAHKLHSFLGFSRDRYILSLSLRDPCDDNPMPPNANTHVVAQSLRGACKVTPALYRSHASSVQPDIIFALADIPHTPSQLPSQKRTTKSIERTLRWLAELLMPKASSPPLSNIFVPLLGGNVIAAREAFSTQLQEPLEGLEAAALPQLRTLDDGVSGYVLDLLPLRLTSTTAPSASGIGDVVPHVQASLRSLPFTRPRIATAPISPHEILRLVSRGGIDLFDSNWVQQAADWGVALDFQFPVVDIPRRPVKLHMGRNIYDDQYAMDFESLSGASGARCPCIACSPSFSPEPIVHSDLDASSYVLDAELSTSPLPVTRAYVHHLLHTHEMSSHALLAAHNLSILSGFFAGIREVVGRGGEALEAEIAKFEERYDEGTSKLMMEEAKRDWEAVDRARGKGRLKREKEDKDKLGESE
ncbi:hypothetical protein BOTBODRAFT_153991 [Botryobasidium botryosum FD-172 SS1]|uniref:tRNA-guanine(15) transglycosylase-like domain-containing protein n=1 Tax=Botryobasidium botryosum (strain FD-172 SS1) TaxID=930990 RepID=A0A067MTJ4_BOTB1|nr:hypothetical protein BOTBODRAFT_153991 [Botryobasidium botryosum FD-172 SS1]